VQVVEGLLETTLKKILSLIYPKEVIDEQAPVNPPPLTDENIRVALFQMVQAITTQAQASTTQAQAMTTQANREVVPWANQQVATMASCLGDFNRINSPTFYGSKKAELSTYQLKDVAQTWEKSKDKVVEFINLRQGCMSVHEYSLKFTKLSKYAPSLVSNPRDKMNRFVTGVTDDLKEECHSAMLHDNITISRLMVHDQQVEEARSKRKSRDAKSARSFDCGSSNWKSSDDRVSKPKPKKGKGTSSPIDKPTCGKCGKKHYRDFLKGTDNYFCCGKSGHKVRDCHNVRGQDKGSGQAQASGANKALKKNRFYALRSRGKQDTSPDVVADILKVFSIDVYALLDPGATLSFIAFLITKKFDVLPDILNEPIIVSTPEGESVVAKRMYRNYPIMLHNRVSYVELVELDTFDFDVILVRVQDLDSEMPPIDPVLVVREFLEVFSNDLPSIPPEREINLGIDLLPDTNPILIPPYRMTLVELKELKARIKNY
ncbi:hypothetical protein EJD97_017461, partial [Solanum chilense]